MHNILGHATALPGFLWHLQRNASNRSTFERLTNGSILLFEDGILKTSYESFLIWVLAIDVGVF
jgi:hypothetical protein